MKNRISTAFTLVGLMSSLLSQSFITGFNQEPVATPDDELAVLQGGLLVQSSNPDTHSVKVCRWVLVTAYSSTPDQTDSTPFITASGTYVHDGIIACNFLPFGAKVRFPDVYGNKVFIVEDRMAKRNSHKMDIWFSTRQEALEFGAQTLKIEVLM